MTVAPRPVCVMVPKLHGIPSVGLYCKSSYAIQCLHSTLNNIDVVEPSVISDRNHHPSSSLQHQPTNSPKLSQPHKSKQPPHQPPHQPTQPHPRDLNFLTVAQNLLSVSITPTLPTHLIRPGTKSVQNPPSSLTQTNPKICLSTSLPGEEHIHIYYVVIY